MISPCWRKTFFFVCKMRNNIKSIATKFYGVLQVKFEWKEIFRMRILKGRLSRIFIEFSSSRSISFGSFYFNPLQKKSVQIKKIARIMKNFNKPVKVINRLKIMYRFEVMNLMKFMNRFKMKNRLKFNPLQKNRFKLRKL